MKQNADSMTLTAQQTLLTLTVHTKRNSKNAIMTGLVKQAMATVDAEILSGNFLTVRMQTITHRIHKITTRTPIHLEIPKNQHGLMQWDKLLAV